MLMCVKAPVINMRRNSIATGTSGKGLGAPPGNGPLAGSRPVSAVVMASAWIIWPGPVDTGAAAAPTVVRAFATVITIAPDVVITSVIAGSFANDDDDDDVTVVVVVVKPAGGGTVMVAVTVEDSIGIVEATVVVKGTTSAEIVALENFTVPSNSGFAGGNGELGTA